MSFFNLGSFVHSDLPVTSGRADTSYHGEIHDPETGRLVKFHTVGQRKSFLARNPNVDPKSLPEVQDPNRAPIWDDANSVAGEPADLRLRAERRARNAALLADPCLTQREATKPTPTYNLFRVCAHESAHAVVAHRVGLIVGRVTTNPRNGNLGETFFSDGPRSSQAITVLAGREGELKMLGSAGSRDGTDTRIALKLAREEAGGDEGKAAELMRTWGQVAKQMVSDNLRAISKLAFELHRRREIDWDDIVAVIDAASVQRLDDEWQRKIAYAQARQGVREYAAEQRTAKLVPAAKVVRTYDCNNTKDVAALLKRFPGLGNGGHDYSVRSK